MVSVCAKMREEESIFGEGVCEISLLTCMRLNVLFTVQGIEACATCALHKLQDPCGER